jgi:hypothetical protein
MNCTTIIIKTKQVLKQAKNKKTINIIIKQRIQTLYLKKPPKDVSLADACPGFGD